MTALLASPWWAAGLVAGASFILGLLATFIISRGLLPDRFAQVESQAADDEEQLAHCIAQLRDLEEQRRRLTDGAYNEQKAQFEARAVALLRAREMAASAPPKNLDGRSAPLRYLAMRPQLRGALWGGGSVSVVAFLYILVQQQQQDVPSAPPLAAASADQNEMQTLTTSLQNDPNNVPTLLRLSHLLLKDQMLSEAKVVNDKILQLAAHEPEALVHAAVLQASEGDINAALERLTDLAKENNLAEAWFFRGMLAMQSGNQSVMRDSFEHFVAVAPEGPQRQRIKAMLDAAKP